MIRSIQACLNHCQQAQVRQNLHQQVPANQQVRVRQPVLANQQARVRQSVHLNRHQPAQVFMSRQAAVLF